MWNKTYHLDVEHKTYITRVHRCAPLTYAKQDKKKLYGRKIWNFKHEGYQKVRCITKDLVYRNNRGTQRRWYIPKFIFLRVLLSAGLVWRPKHSKHLGCLDTAIRIRIPWYADTSIFQKHGYGDTFIYI
jgi:hypothetical protein